MAKLRGTVCDRASGRPLEARVCVVGSSGAICYPRDALLKASAGPGGLPAPATGTPFFYSDGSFALDVPTGPTRLRVERGTEYRPFDLSLTAESGRTVDIDIALERWINLGDEGWYAGNTHVHYGADETRAETRLRLDPRVEDLPVLVVSVLQRGAEAYASNSFPIGIHERGPLHVVDIGEEARHNSSTWEIGYGHVMLMGIHSVVQPISTGILNDEVSADYPPLIDACDEAHRQGGLVIWCHNGIGLEAPVAAINGRLDAINIFDPWWMEPEYEIWYHLLNCGIRLPISTGSDWFICSSNRVYAHAPGTLRYESWLEAVRDGRTFATNGPVLRMVVDGHEPSGELLSAAAIKGHVRTTITWESLLPIDRVELIADGRPLVSIDVGDAGQRGAIDVDVPAETFGWLAARCGGMHRTSFDQAVWAHTSPVFLNARSSDASRRSSASYFVSRIRDAELWVQRSARFEDDAQRARLESIYHEAAGRFADLSK